MRKRPGALAGEKSGSFLGRRRNMMMETWVLEKWSKERVTERSGPGNTQES